MCFNDTFCFSVGNFLIWRLYNSTEQENVGQKMDVYQSLKTLKDVERTCITLFYMEDLSIDKIAGITGIPAGTVKSHLSRGKDKLATYLKQNGYDRNRQ